jgi:soluble lytic murein transglycosylase
MRLQDLRSGSPALAGFAFAISALLTTAATDVRPRPPVVDTSVNTPTLLPTAHPPIPKDETQFWLVPRSSTAPSPVLKELARAIDLIAGEEYAAAATRLRDPRLAKTPVADYAQYYSALVDLRMGSNQVARDGFRRLNSQQPPGMLGEWSLLGEAEAAEVLGDTTSAARLYTEALARKPEHPDEVLAAIGRTQKAAGSTQAAIAAFRELYYLHPLSPLADEAKDELSAISGITERDRLVRDAQLELGRAERLFAAQRYADAKTAFAGLVDLLSGDDRDKARLRIAESDHYLGNYQSAIEGTRPFVERGARLAEARFFQLSAIRGAGHHETYVEHARRLPVDFPDSSWAEETLNNLATHYIRADDDPAAIEVFAHYLTRFPSGRYAPRAAWKVGWWRYRQGDYANAVVEFERAAATFPRSDYRPAWLYWTARAYDRLQQKDLAAARYALITADYLNSYYGRLADEQLRKRGITETRRATLAGVPAPLPSEEAPAQSAPSTSAPAPALPPTHARIRQLITAGLPATALAEVQYAKRMWGSSPALEATLGFLLKARGDYRAGINAMKRAYPQYLTPQADQLPLEARRVIYPLDYWDLIRRHASARKLDPYLIAALVAQESTFDAEIRSSANAYGLMQILPSTGKNLARSLRIRRFSTSTLIDPEANIRMGTLYFRNLVDELGGTHYALASYNAGEHRVVRWIAERGDLPRDEFIDDIPYPETQNYVKRILGTAEDYRKLYGRASWGGD